jgi:hypothetical protein
MSLWPIVLLALVFASGCGSGYDFDTGSNMGWRTAGLYEDGTLTPITGYFGDDSASWVDGQNSPTAPPAFDPLSDGIGCIVLGLGGATLPEGPLGYWAWHFNSPDLSQNEYWQGKAEIRADLVADMASTQNSEVWAEFVVKVKKPDTTISYYTDDVFHSLPLNVSYTSNSWKTFTLDMTSLGMPAGTTILNVNIRIFGHAGVYDGFVLLDNVFCF